MVNRRYRHNGAGAFALAYTTNQVMITFISFRAGAKADQSDRRWQETFACGGEPPEFAIIEPCPTRQTA